MIVLLSIPVLVGHAFVWVALINVSHATALPERLVRAVTVASFALSGLIPAGLVGGFVAGGWSLAEPSDWLRLPWPVKLYLLVCLAAGALAAARWTWRRAWSRHLGVQRSFRCRRLRPLAPQGDASPPLLVRMVGNEILDLQVTERELELPRLPPALDGLKIVHLSDLHFTGWVDPGYFRALVGQCNALAPDLVAVTGDLIDHARYIAWIPETLGELAARSGVYFVLGNHDRRYEPERIRRTLCDCGLTDLGSRWIRLQVRGVPVVMAGNERPWFAPAADLGDGPPPSSQGGPLRIALGHSPDQFPWARASQVDLFLVGHTHGGQIRLPVVGAVFSPCLTGVRYDRGTFYAPPTVMHVTQGVSAKPPIRVNCPPEIVELTLRSPNRSPES
jgi:predicted MPP superfamily phosphohydrolase